MNWRGLVLFLALLLPRLVLAEDVQVLSLYDAKSHVPGVLIPFKVGGTFMQNATLHRVWVAQPDDGLCQTMVDPFIKSVFHLKCTDEASVQIMVRVLASSGQYYDIDFGPVSVVRPFTGSVVVKPLPPSPSPAILAGRQLFGTYCIRCHADASVKAKRTAAQILNAVTVRDEMKHLAPVLTSADYDKLAAYLGTL